MPAVPGGVGITGFIAPKDAADAYPVIDPIYGIGGLREVADDAARDAITFDRRREGMLVYVIATGVYWKLLPGPWSGTPADWDKASFGSLKFSTLIGDGVATEYAVTHNLGTQAVTVSVREVAANQIVLVDVVANSVNQVTLRFDQPPAASSYEVTVSG